MILYFGYFLAFLAVLYIEMTASEVFGYHAPYLNYTWHLNFYLDW